MIDCVAVTSPIKIGMGGNVGNGWLGSCVGIFTMVGDADGTGVNVDVGVSINVYVMKIVEVGCGVLVTGAIPQACRSIVVNSRKTIFRMRE